MLNIKRLICIKDFKYSRLNRSNIYKEGKIYLVQEYNDIYDFFICEETREPNSPLPLESLPYVYRENFISLSVYRKLKLDKINENR